MAQPLRCLMIGSGGMAGAWIRSFFPLFKDRTEIVAVVDVNEEVARSAGEFVGLPSSAIFTNMADAFEKVEADYCTIVIPPAFHKEAVLHAAARKMPILSEKPIADTWDDCLEIYRAVTEADIPMQVVQNYRYTPRIRAFKKAIADGRIGQPNYLIARYASDYRNRNSWGKFRHEIPHSLLVEGSVHHFDQMRNLTSADCETISGYDWNLNHPSFDGESCGLFVMKMTNDWRGAYEGNSLEAGWDNSWYNEYYRAEGDEGALVLDKGETVKLLKRQKHGGLIVEDLEPIRAQHEAHNAIIDQFLTWREGGPTPETVVQDNIKSAAMLFAAVQASDTGQVVHVPSMLPE
jgi:predicted dehydrogenase